MGTVQDKLGRGVVNAGCVGFRSLWRATALRGKEPSVGSCPEVPARKSKMLAAHCLFGRVDASIVALTIKTGA